MDSDVRSGSYLCMEGWRPEFSVLARIDMCSTCMVAFIHIANDTLLDPKRSGSRSDGFQPEVID